jgi:hypothetical protein
MDASNFVLTASDLFLLRLFFLSFCSGGFGGVFDSQDNRTLEKAEEILTKHRRMDGSNVMIHCIVRTYPSW